ncbi:MAG TPA: tripartite tricarboxylate transporter substrate binding protein [Acidisphaera sp.]|nr:tripartite tricarboxylate transporter substrate binding protein [Acidisphaera sp.]
MTDAQLPSQPSRRGVLVLATGLLGTAAVRARAQGADWKPGRPINLIVPWAAGGATDQVTRISASVLEKPLGQTIVIINQPGASGAIGTNSALSAARDGYTWTAGAVQDLGAYETLGTAKTRLSDWHLYLSVANLPVLSVKADAPYRSANELIAAMAAHPGKITVATAGVTSSGHMAIDMLAKAAKVTYRLVTYDGGSPAVLATVSGEADATTQLATEQADMIRGKLLRPLCTISDKKLELDGYGTIPPLSDTLPGFTAPDGYFGIFIPNGVPDEVIATMDRVWSTTIANSDLLRKFANTHGALFAPLEEAAAQKAAFPAAQANAWMLFNNGQAKVSPASVGIPAI